MHERCRRICVPILLLTGLLFAGFPLLAEDNNRKLFDFNIKRQALSTALLDFSYQCNVQVVLPGYLAEGLLAKAVAGKLTPAKALDVLLTGSNLQYEFIGTTTVTITRKPVQKQVSGRRRVGQFAVEQLLVTAADEKPPLQDVSISFASLNGEDLESRGVTKADELQQFVPGLTVESAQLGSTEFSIRGVGFSNDDLSTQPGVGVFIDDIYIPRQGPANMALYEIDRVQVLRGPQAILYGRNATGGALVYRTKKPSADFEARYLIDVGDQGRFNNTLALNGPLAYGITGQFAVASFQRDPIMNNRNPSEPQGNNTDSLSARAAIRIAKDDQVEWLFSMDTENTDQLGVLYSIGPGEPFQFAPGLPSVPASNPLRSADVSFTGRERLRLNGIMARANISAANYDASYILGYRKHKLFGAYDLDQTRAELVNKRFSEQSSLSSFEARFSSPEKKGRPRNGDVSWLTGVYLLNEDADTVKEFFAPGLNAGDNTWQQDLANTHYALYAQGRYALTDSVQLIGGVRYLAEFKDFELLAQSDAATAGNPYIQENFGIERRRDWRRLVPRIGVHYEYNPDVSMYVSVGAGYKPGGYPGTPGTQANAINSFKHERAESLELGLRSVLFANRIKVHLAAFFADYQGLQVFGTDAFGNNLTANAEKTDINGFELEAQARLGTNLKLSMGLSFVAAEFDDFILSIDGQPLDKSGDQVPRVPDGTLNLSAVYFFPETKYGAFSMRTDAIYSEEAVDIRSEPAWSSYKTVNLWFDFIAYSGIWEVGAWVRNITDEVYFQATSPGITAAGTAFARKLQPPRLYGVSFKYHW